MLDTTTTGGIYNPELQELYTRRNYVNVYLDIALPAARAEENLDLNEVISSCGTRGCVLFYFCKAIGFYLCKSNQQEAWDACEYKMFGERYLLECAFTDDECSLDHREIRMTEYRDELTAQINALESVVA